uniref:Uncharacterized protein n=1 Tax=Cajanus cajan TaxID=3821 RepID=A0A151R933_CAJCA|nr:hypothetical protein KK1_039572 [Cajanus cajan]
MLLRERAAAAGGGGGLRERRHLRGERAAAARGGDAGGEVRRDAGRRQGRQPGHVRRQARLPDLLRRADRRRRLREPRGRRAPRRRRPAGQPDGGGVGADGARGGDAPVRRAELHHLHWGRQRQRLGPWPSALPRQHLDLVARAGIVLLQREIPDPVIAQVAQVGPGRARPFTYAFLIV